MVYQWYYKFIDWSKCLLINFAKCVQPYCTWMLLINQWWIQKFTATCKKLKTRPKWKALLGEVAFDSQTTIQNSENNPKHAETKGEVQLLSSKRIFILNCVGGDW